MASLRGLAHEEGREGDHSHVQGLAAQIVDAAPAAKVVTGAPALASVVGIRHVPELGAENEDPAGSEKTSRLVEALPERNPVAREAPADHHVVMPWSSRELCSRLVVRTARHGQEAVGADPGSLLGLNPPVVHDPEPLQERLMVLEADIGDPCRGIRLGKEELQGFEGVPVPVALGHEGQARRFRTPGRGRELINGPQAPVPPAPRLELVRPESPPSEAKADPVQDSFPSSLPPRAPVRGRLRPSSSESNGRDPIACRFIVHRSSPAAVFEIVWSVEP